MILPVIMAGGSGSRLWPLSRTHYPKQFHNLLGKSSLLIDTITRLDNIKHQPPLVICNEDHRFLVAEQFRKHSLSTSGIILEPIGKNTCPAIALAAFQAVKTNEDPYLLVLAADHSIGDRDSFQKAIHQAYETAKTGSLVTFGIIPTSPETGYGYIKQGKSLNKYAYYVDGFKEKPNIILANEYINSGHYLWNSGMFLFKASSFLKELKKFEPKIYRLCEESIDNSTHDLDFIRIDSDAFSNCKSQSVDFAIMEQTKNCAVVPMNADWSDVGSWSALWELSKKDDRNNYFYGDVVAIDCDSNF
ncbi:mannose-1-phosphate guanylyltransferase/mannose-6-phosphate isomerase, partial [Escherichia coli]|nr:mannose-1-phosphate guanylyltransferase/mannose-6-phosphate isomerase [Escherichia coli]